MTDEKVREVMKQLIDNIEVLNMAIKTLDSYDKIIEQIKDEADYAYADFDRYKEDILYAEPDELPDDDFRYGLRRAIEIMREVMQECHECMWDSKYEQQPCEDFISKESVIEWLKDKDIIKMNYQEENARRELAELTSVIPSYNSIKPELKQSSGDCISREQALKVIETEKQGWEGTERYAIDECHTRIAELPSVAPTISKMEQVEDCISREEAINELKLAYFNNDLQSVKDDPCIVDAMIDWAIRTIKRLPSVTSQPTRWIPVSERLPEEDGTLRGYLVNVGYWVGIACFVNGEFWQSYAPEKMRFDYPVKAWMPLPTPYAESDEEEEKNEDNSL